jgi:hypothetical protein
MDGEDIGEGDQLADEPDTALASVWCREQRYILPQQILVYNLLPSST